MKYIKMITLIVIFLIANFFVLYNIGYVDYYRSHMHSLVSLDPMMQILLIMLYTWIFGLLVLGFAMYYKRYKERKAPIQTELENGDLKDYAPEVVEYLFEKKVSTRGLTASILNLVRKKQFRIELCQGTDNQYKLVANQGVNTNMTKAEECLYKWLMQAGTLGQVPFPHIHKYVMLNPPMFREFFEMWKNYAMMEVKKEDFFVRSIGMQIFTYVYIFLGLGLTIMAFIYKAHIWILLIALLLFIASLICVATFKRRTVYGNEEHHKWVLFKQLLFNHDVVKGVDAEVLGSQYLMYAIAVGYEQRLLPYLSEPYIQIIDFLHLFKKNERIKLMSDRER